MPNVTPDQPRRSGVDQPLVSVILPVYNGEASIGETLESALSQTYRNLEIIVIDDGSTDRTLAIVEARAARDARVKIIRQANGGVARARNQALQAARGEFVAPLDADDLWDPAKIELQVARMLEAGNETGLVYCWWVWIDGNGGVLDRSPRWQVEGDALGMLFQVNYTGSASVPLYRRCCLDQIGGYDEKLEAENGRGCEDWDIALKVAERARVAVVPAMLVGYRRRPDSMSTCLPMMWRSRCLVIAALRQRQPGLTAASLQRSADQFALYLAGVSFWSGHYFRAVRWGLRAWRSGLMFHVLPYVARVFARRLALRRSKHAVVMVPGLSLDTRRIPEPLIPYDRIYGNVAPKKDSLRGAHVPDAWRLT
jgi:glycosyltransferase involved in cell wall biosynthesis